MPKKIILIIIILFFVFIGIISWNSTDQTSDVLSGVSGDDFFLLKKSKTELNQIEKSFKEKNGENWDVVVNPYTGSISDAIANNLKQYDSIPNNAEVTKQITQALTENKGFFGFEAFSLIANSNKLDSPNVIADYFIEPSQDYKGIYIYANIPSNNEEGENKKGRELLKDRAIALYEKDDITGSFNLTIMFRGITFYPNIEIATDFKISKNEAIESVYENGSLKTGGIFNRAQKIDRKKFLLEAKRLVILPIENKAKNKLYLKLAWQVGGTEAGQESLQNFYVDAKTGQLLFQALNIVE